MALAQRRVDIVFRIGIQLYFTRPNIILAQALFPSVDVIRVEVLGLVARLHVHDNAVNVLLNTRHRLRYTGGGHCVADQRIDQQILVDVFRRLNQIDQIVVAVGRNILPQIIRQQSVTLMFIQ
nr:hypothetical protein [Escherichia sp. ESNIH1]